MLTAEIIGMIGQSTVSASYAHEQSVISLNGQDYQDLTIYKLIDD